MAGARAGAAQLNDSPGTPTADESHSASRLTVFIALAANIVLAAAKGAAGMVTGSRALTAEAAHSVADTMNEVFLLVSLWQSKREPDEAHPFGYGKERFFWALMAAVFIFVAGASFAVYRGVRGLMDPGGHDIDHLPLSFAVLGVALLTDGASFLRALHQAKQGGNGSILGALRRARRSKDPALKTVLLEDGAALTGVAIAAAGLGLVAVTGDPAWDAAASVAIGLLLALVAVTLGRDIKSLLVGQAASPQVRRRIHGVIAGFPEIDTVLECLTMHLGPHEILVAVRLDLVDTVTGSEVEQVSDRIDRALREAVPEVTEVFLDATPERTHRKRST